MNQWSNLLHYRIPLISLIITNSDLSSGSVFYRLISLFDGQNIRRLEIDSIQRVRVKNDLFASSGDLAIYDHAVGNAAVCQQKTPPGV